MAEGNVYLFNTTNQKIRVTLNDNPLPPIPPAPGEGGNYQASYIIVERSDATSIDDPVFAQNNTMMIMFPGVSNHYSTVSVNPATSSSNNDLLLYIFYGSIVLVDAVTNTVLLNTHSS